MIEDEEYELTPHKMLEELRSEVEKLKKNPYADSGSSKSLLEAMDKLRESINELIEIFKSAHDDMIQNEGSDSGLGKKVDRLAEENKKIAHGIVSLAEMIKRDKPAAPPISPPPVQRRVMPPPVAPPIHPPPTQNRKAIFDKF